MRRFYSIRCSAYEVRVPDRVNNSYGCLIMLHFYLFLHHEAIANVNPEQRNTRIPRLRHVCVIASILNARLHISVYVSALPGVTRKEDQRMSSLFFFVIALHLPCEVLALLLPREGHRAFPFHRRFRQCRSC